MNGKWWKMPVKLLEIDEKECTGCRSCEIACSYHLKRVFSSAESAIRISWDNTEGKMKIVILGNCEVCASDEKPPCVKFCARNVLKVHG